MDKRQGHQNLQSWHVCLAAVAGWRDGLLSSINLALLRTLIIGAQAGTVHVTPCCSTTRRAMEGMVLRVLPSAGQRTNTSAACGWQRGGGMGVREVGAPAGELQAEGATGRGALPNRSPSIKKLLEGPCLQSCLHVRPPARPAAAAERPSAPPAAAPPAPLAGARRARGSAAARGPGRRRRCPRPGAGAGWGRGDGSIKN